MNKHYLYIFLLLFFLQGCKERNDSIIDYSNNNVSNAEFSISSIKSESVAVTDFDQNVLIEDFTGMACINCPRAHKKAEGYIVSNPNRVGVIVFHSYDAGLGSVAEPVKRSKNDFRTVFGTDLGKYFGVNKLPQWAINRTVFSGESGIAINSENSWPDDMASQLLLKTNVEILLVDKKYDSISRKLTANFKLIYSQASVDTQNVSLYFVENEINDLQEDITGINPYVHNHVFRKAQKPENGLVINSTRKKGDAVYINLNTTLDSTWNFNNLDMTILLTKNSLKNRSVIQSKTIPIK